MGKQWKQWKTLFWGATKSLQMVTTAMKLKDACSLEEKLWPTLGRKVMTNLDSMFKSRDITLSRKVHIVKAMIFPVVMFGCENWTVKKAECWRIDAFELWCWRRLLRVPWTARREVLGVLWKDWCWSWNSNILASWCEELIHWKRHWCWDRSKVGGEGNSRGWDGWMASPSQWTWVWVNSGSWQWTGKTGVLRFLGSNMTKQLNWLIIQSYCDNIDCIPYTIHYIPMTYFITGSLCPQSLYLFHPVPPFASRLATTSLFSASTNLFLFCFDCWLCF